MERKKLLDMSSEKPFTKATGAPQVGAAQGDDTTNNNQENSDARKSPDNISYDENACVVCFKNVDLFSVGECDHPVCYECSTRMRVLCQQNECPICRQVLSKVRISQTIFYINVKEAIIFKYERVCLQLNKYPILR